jgi:hypothetical protein
LGIRPANDAVKATWQPGQERLDGMDRAPQVDVDHPAPVVVRHLRDRTRDHNAGIAEDHVDLTEKTKCLIGEVNHLLEIPDIAHHAVRFEPLGLQMRDRLLQRRLIDVGEHDSRSPPCELGRGRETDTVCAAGDDGAFAFISVHGATVADWTRRAATAPVSRALFQAATAVDR